MSMRPRKGLLDPLASCSNDSGHKLRLFSHPALQLVNEARYHHFSIHYLLDGLGFGLTSRVSLKR